MYHLCLFLKQSWSLDRWRPPKIHYKQQILSCWTHFALVSSFLINFICLHALLEAICFVMYFWSKISTRPKSQNRLCSIISILIKIFRYQKMFTIFSSSTDSRKDKLFLGPYYFYVIHRNIWCTLCFSKNVLFLLK